MNQPMRLLYDYALDTGFTVRLRTPEYRSAELSADQLLRRLNQTLTGEHLTLFAQYVDAVQTQQHLELEAMFQAAFSLPGELG